MKRLDTRILNDRDVYEHIIATAVGHTRRCMFTLRVVGLDDPVARDKNGQRVALHAEATARTAFGLPTLIATCAYVSTVTVRLAPPAG